MIVADTGAIIALLDAREEHHGVLRRHFVADPAAWLLPWAILPEIDYLVATRLGADLERLFISDVASGTFVVEWGDPRDLIRANELAHKHRALKLGLVDAVVMAIAERLEADAIATLDVRHFGAVAIRGAAKLLPRDL